ncbi:aromatic-ring-hydroxylating dioxygenase subunit beta [Bordetella bronchialis]|uniref:Ring-hydroxylating dioxygenase subunit beta n=1 Tax=Bordetella bronchialis TaxID=463025 RepID=A0A193FXF1_9BORD|nr:aromatic-ring-hydroxylating dioxygenase subunit beta [Bordetella bronchialis]ANN66968.1 ring-hydroxylating dioxygenase subunit beta [Bordetella bronchialis]ANN72043.1 ring-hydroxylating dioxygenase subunit beta [Bordetella bronchialis]
MKTNFSYSPRRIDLARAIALRQEIEEFHADYCAALDANQIESWPDFFTEDALYRVTARENADRGLLVGLVYAEGRDMMQDRAIAISRTQMFAPRHMRHLVTNTRVLDESPDGIEAQSSFLLLQTLVEGPTTLHLAGFYHDVFVRAEGASTSGPLKLKERQVIYDTEILANDLVYPV